jgi:precorrin-6B methylase 2
MGTKLLLNTFLRRLKTGGRMVQMSAGFIENSYELLKYVTNIAVEKANILQSRHYALVLLAHS